MISDDELKTEIESIFGSTLKAISPLSSAQHAEILRLTLENGSSYVAKRSPHSLDEEAHMLDTLKQLGGLPVPEVFHATPQVLIMEYIHSDWQMDESAQTDAAIHLARLHKVQGETYGFEYDTYIAGLRQSNASCDSWAEFFIQNRLLHMAELAFRHNKIDKDLMKKIDKLASKAPSIIGAGNPPVLIHGDCWSGNLLPYQGKIRAFIDPAIYYADHEMELAFLSLFDTVEQSFFSRYEQEIEIKPGFFEERRLLYNIYPLLVHTLLFGVSYARKVKQRVDKFV